MLDRSCADDVSVGGRHDGKRGSNAHLDFEVGGDQYGSIEILASIQMGVVRAGRLKNSFVDHV